MAVPSSVFYKGERTADSRIGYYYFKVSGEVKRKLSELPPDKGRQGVGRNTTIVGRGLPFQVDSCRPEDYALNT